MEWSCCSCGHDVLHKLRPYRTHTRYGADVFGGSTLYECEGCGLVQMLPRPESSVLDAYYEHDYRRAAFTGSDVANVSEFPLDNLYYYNRGQSVSELISRHGSFERPRILDIGAGFGHILHALGERYPGATRLAIEYSDVCVAHLRAIGVEVITRPIEEALPGLGRSFDVVVLSHVLEHLLDPRATLRLIREALAPNGIFYVEVPNIPADSLLRYPDHKWAARFDEPHITFFSTETLRDLLGAAEFDLRFCDTAGPEYAYVSRLRYSLPSLRPFVQSLIPTSMFLGLRKLSVTQGLRVHTREPSFYEYGGDRLWIRTVSALPGSAPEV